jgi:P27 family predicted phage terminase small subunit
MRGRKPSLSTLLTLLGPTPPEELPECPPHVAADPEAAAEWHRIGPALAGILAPIDRAALASYCILWSRWVAAETKLRETGLVVRSPQGGAVQSPYLAIARGALTPLHSFLSEFGLTPVSRARLLATTEAPDDEPPPDPPIPSQVVAVEFEQLAFARDWQFGPCPACGHRGLLTIPTGSETARCRCGEDIRTATDAAGRPCLKMGEEDPV